MSTASTEPSGTASSAAAAGSARQVGSHRLGRTTSRIGIAEPSSSVTSAEATTAVTRIRRTGTGASRRHHAVARPVRRSPSASSIAASAIGMSTAL